MKSIIAGQYIDSDSPIHSIDPRSKIIFLFCYLFILILWPNLTIHVLSIILLSLITKYSELPCDRVVKFIWGIRYFVIITLLIHLLFSPEKTGLNFWIFNISKQGALKGLVFSTRLLILVWMAAILNWTTAPVSLADAFEKTADPLKKIGIPVRDFATMLLLAMRFLPTLLSDTKELILAQRARGLEIGQGKLINKIKSIIPLLVPMIIGAFRRADSTAIALTVRGYNRHTSRTNLYPLSMNAKDYFVISLAMIFLICSIIIKIVT